MFEIVYKISEECKTYYSLSLHQEEIITEYYDRIRDTSDTIYELLCDLTNVHDDYNYLDQIDSTPEESIFELTFSDIDSLLICLN